MGLVDAGLDTFSDVCTQHPLPCANENRQMLRRVITQRRGGLSNASAGRRVFICNVPGCGRVCRSAASFANHRKSHEVQERIICSGCGQEFASASDYTIHRTSSGCGSHSRRVQAMHAGAAVQEPVDVEQPCLDEECDDVMSEFAMWTEEMDRMLGGEDRSSPSSTPVDDNDGDYVDRYDRVDEVIWPDTLDAKLPAHICDYTSIQQHLMQHVDFLRTLQANEHYPYSNSENKRIREWMYSYTHTTRECVNELLHILNDNFTFANVASNINVIEEEERQHIPEKFVPYHPLHDIPEMADTTIYVASILHEMQSALFKREVNTSPSLEHDESGERVYSHPWTGTFWETRSQKLETEHPNALPLYFSIFGDATTVTNFKSLSVHPFTFSLMGDDIRMRQSAAGNPVLVYASELKSMLCQHMCAATDCRIGPASISVEDFRGVRRLYIQRICLRLLAEVITVQQRGGIGMYCYDAETGDIQYKKVFPVLQNLTVDGGERKYLLGIYPQQSGVKQACYICDCPGHALNNIERFPLRLDIMDEVLIEELVTEYQAGNLEWVKQQRREHSMHAIRVWC